MQYDFSSQIRDSNPYMGLFKTCLGLIIYQENICKIILCGWQYVVDQNYKNKSKEITNWFNKESIMQKAKGWRHLNGFTHIYIMANKCIISTFKNEKNINRMEN